MALNYEEKEVDFSQLEKDLEVCCQECDLYETDQCEGSKCLIGFAKKVVKFSKVNGTLSISGGSSLIPTGDFKVYNTEVVAKNLATTCAQCKQCRENHSDDCIIALIRKSLENTVLRENISYPGSVLMYLMQVSKQNTELAQKIKEKLYDF